MVSRKGKPYPLKSSSYLGIDLIWQPRSQGNNNSDISSLHTHHHIAEDYKVMGGVRDYRGS